MAHWRCAVGFTQLCKPPGSVLLMYQQVESPTCNKSRLYQPLGPQPEHVACQPSTLPQGLKGPEKQRFS